MARLGENMVRINIDNRVKQLSGRILNIIELLVSSNDSRFDSARRQILDEIGEFNRKLNESIRSDFQITPTHQETIVDGR